MHVTRDAAGEGEGMETDGFTIGAIGGLVIALIVVGIPTIYVLLADRLGW